MASPSKNSPSSPPPPPPPPDAVDDDVTGAEDVLVDEDLEEEVEVGGADDDPELDVTATRVVLAEDSAEAKLLIRRSVKRGNGTNTGSLTSPHRRLRHLL